MAKLTEEEKLERFKKIFSEAKLVYAFPQSVTEKGIDCVTYEEPRFELTKKQLYDFLKYQDPDDMDSINEIEEYIKEHPSEKNWYFDIGLSVRYDLINDGYEPTEKINDYTDVLDNIFFIRFCSKNTDGNLDNPLEIKILNEELLNVLFSRVKGHMEENIQKFNEIVELQKEEKWQNSIDVWNQNKEGTNADFVEVGDLHLVDPDSEKQQELIVKAFEEVSISLDKSLAKTILEMANFDEESFFFMFDESTGNFIEIDKDEKIVDVESPSGMLNYISGEIEFRLEVFSSLPDEEKESILKIDYEKTNIDNLFKLNDILKLDHSNSMNKSIVIQDSEWGDVLVVTHGKYNGKEGWYYGLFNQHMDISNVEDNLAFYTDEHIHENFKKLIEPGKITALDVARQILIDHQDYGWQRSDSEKDYSEQWLKQTGTELSFKEQQEYLNELDKLLSEKFSKNQKLSLLEEYNEIKEKCIKDGTFMKAPNGEPTNLSETEWLFLHSNEGKKILENWEYLAAYKFATEGDSINNLTGSEFQKVQNESIIDRVLNYYTDILDNHVSRMEVGEVILDRKGIRDSIAHGLGKEKAAAFAAVPDVIRKGIIYNRESNWKGRNYDTAVIIAPVKIGDKIYAEEVVLKKSKNSNKFYLHEVEIKEKLQELFKTLTEECNSRSSYLIISQHIEKIKNCNIKLDNNYEPTSEEIQKAINLSKKNKMLENSYYLPKKYEGYTASVFEPRFTDILNELKPKGMKPFTDEEVKDLFVYTGTDIFKVENGHLNRYYTDTNDKLVFQCEGLGSLLKMVEDWSWDSAGNTMKDETDTLDVNYLSNIHFKNRLKEFNRESAKEKLITSYEGKYYVSYQSSSFHDVLNAFTPEGMNITSEGCDLILKNIDDELIVENGELIRKINGEDNIEGVGLLNLLETAYFNASDNVYGKSSVDEAAKLHSLIREYNFYNKIEHNPLNFNFSGFTEENFKKYQEHIKEGYDAHEELYGEVGDIWIHAFEHDEDESQELYYTVFAHEETEYFSDGKLKKSIDSSDYSSKIILSKDFILNSDYKTFIEYLEKNMTEEIFQNENLLIEAQRPLLINWNNEFGETVKNQKIIERKLEKDMDFSGLTKEKYNSMQTAIASRGKDSRNHEIYGYFEVGDMRISVESLEETAVANHTITLRPEYPGTEEDFVYEATIDGKKLSVSHKYDDVDIPCGNLTYDEFKKTLIIPLAENLNRNKLNEHVLRNNISWAELAVKKEPEHIVTSSVNFNCGYAFDEDTRNGSEEHKQEVIKAVIETIKDKYDISENDMQTHSFNDMVNIRFAFPVPLAYCYPQEKTDEWVKLIEKQLTDDFGMYADWQGRERLEDKFHSKEQARDFITKIREYEFRPNIDYVMSNITAEEDFYEVQMLTEEEINFFLNENSEYYPVRGFLNKSYNPIDPVTKLYGNLYISKNGNAVIDIVSETESGETRVNDYRLDADVPSSLMQKYQEAIALYDYKHEKEIQFEKHEDNSSKLRILVDIFDFTKTIPDFSENDAKLICELMCADPEVDGFSFEKDHFVRKDLHAHVEHFMTVPEVLEMCRQISYDILVDSDKDNPNYETLQKNNRRMQQMSEHFNFGFISNALKNHHDRSFEEQRKLVNDNSKYVHIISIEDNATRICEEVLSNDFKLNFSMIPVSGMAENVQKTLTKLTEYSFDEVCVELGFTEKEGYEKLAVLIQASDYFNNVFDRPRPTAEDIQRAVEDGWSLEAALDGYSRFHTDDIDERLEVIERIDVSNLFESDLEAALQSEKDGIKLIPVEEMDFSKDTDGTYSSYRYTDTEKNREVLKELGFMKQEIELKPGMKFFTTSKESDHFLIVGNRTVQKISKDKKMIMDNRGVEYFVDSSEVIYDEKTFDNYFSKGPEKWSTQGGGGWKHFVVNHKDDGMIRIYPANVTEDRYDDIYHVTYFDEPIVNKDVSTWNESGNLYYADNVNVLKKHLMEQLNIKNLSQYVDQKLTAEQSYKGLRSAIENKDSQTVALYIEKLKDTNNVHHYLDQAMYDAVTVHDFETFKNLIENGANIDWKIEDPENAGHVCNVLHFAAYRNDARFINYVNEYLSNPRDLVTLNSMLNQTDGYDETPFDVAFRVEQENIYSPYQYNECVTSLKEMEERIKDVECLVFQDNRTGDYLTVEQSDLLYMINLYDANKNWLKHDSFEGYLDPETKEDCDINSKYHAGLTAMDDLIKEGRWSTRTNFKIISDNDKLSEELALSREENSYVAYKVDFNVKISMSDEEQKSNPKSEIKERLFTNIENSLGPMDADQKEYFFMSTEETEDFNGNSLLSGNFSLDVPAKYCNPKEKADEWVKTILEKIKKISGYYSAERLEVRDDYLETKDAVEQYRTDRRLLDNFTVKDWNNLVKLNEGFDYSSTMVTDDYSKLTYAKLKDNIKRYYSMECKPVLSVGKLTKLDDLYKLDNLEDYYLVSTLGKQLNDDELALEVCNMIVESLKDDELQIIEDTINPDDDFGFADRTKNKVTYYESLDSLYADFADCSIEFSVIYDSNSNEIYTNADLNVTRSDETNFFIELPDSIDAKLNEKLDARLKITGLIRRDLFVSPAPERGFDKNNELNVNEFALFVQEKGMNISSETAAIILKYMDFEDYRIYQDKNNNLCIYDNSEDFNGKGELFTPKQLLEFTKSQILKAKELGYSNFRESDLLNINKALGINNFEQNRKQGESGLEKMMNDYDSRSYKNPLEEDVHPVFGEIKKMLPFCKNPNDPCEALNLLCHKWDNEGQSEKKREVLKYISQNTRTDVKSLTAYFEKNLNMKVSITPPGRKEPEQSRSKYYDSGLGR